MSSPLTSPAGLKNLEAENRFDRFVASWNRLDAARDRRPAIVVAYFAGLILICGTTLLIGAVPTKIFGHDVFVAAEMGWRVMHGQRPYVDFTSAWGPVWYLVSALGLTISRHSINGIGYGSAIVALIVGTWSFFLAKNRLPSSWRIIFGLFLAALVASPYCLGDSPLLSTHAMVYNRYGYALLGVILVECFEESWSWAGRHGEQWIGGISTGAALSLTLFLKANFFLVGLGLLAILSLLLRRLDYRRVCGILLGFLAVSFCLLAYLHFDLVALVRDLRMAGAARGAALTGDAFVAKVMNRPSVMLNVVLFAFVASLFFGNRVRRWRGPNLAIIGVFLFAADMGLMLTNAQWDGFPMCAVFGILIASELMLYQRTLPTPEGRYRRPLFAGALCLAAILFVPLFASDLTGLAYGVWDKHRTPPEQMAIPFSSPNLAPLLLYNGHVPRSNGTTFTTYVNDGVALLERESRPDEKILSMDMTNAFPYALERVPPHGGIASPTYHFNIDDQHKPSEDEFFGDADIVMVPKHPALDEYYYRDFLRAYEPAIHRRYRLAAQSDWWWMYRRK